MLFIKPNFIVGFAAGYVLGSRAGRERYEQIAAGARKFAGSPTVQSAASKAQETVSTQAPVVADAVKDKATSAASAVAGKVRSSDDPAPTNSTPTNTTPTNTTP